MLLLQLAPLTLLLQLAQTTGKNDVRAFNASVAGVLPELWVPVFKGLHQLDLELTYIIEFKLVTHKFTLCFRKHSEIYHLKYKHTLFWYTILCIDTNRFNYKVFWQHLLSKATNTYCIQSNPRKKQNHQSFQKCWVAIFEKLAEIKNKTPHLSKYICEFLTDQGANSRQVWKSVQMMTYWHTNYKFQMVYIFDIEFFLW